MTTDPERLAARDETRIKELVEALDGVRYLCQSEGNRWEGKDAKTWQHWHVRAGDVLAAQVLLQDLHRQLAEARQDGERLAAERDAWRDYSEAKEGLLVAYRTGRGPSGKLWAKIERTRETIDRLAAARASLSNDNG